MNNKKIREAFSKVKGDIFSLGEEIRNLKLLIADMRNELKILTQAFKDMQNLGKIPVKNLKQAPTHPEEKPTIQQITPTHKEIPTDKLLSQVLKGQNLDISTGNEGVPTDRQTNQQTDRQMIQHKKQQIQEKEEELSEKNKKINRLEKAAEILDSLDALKKELRLKIKRLTEKEMQVFSLLYSLENSNEIVDYPLLSSKLQLSESSIRDYIGKIQRKGIPIIKEKINNKKIVLHISPDLKKIASLPTIIKLREI